MYESYEELMERKLAMVTDRRDKRQGSLIFDAMAPNSAEMATFYAELELLEKRTFGDTATGSDLTRRSAERGIVRKEALFATFYGALLDAEGKRFEAVNGCRFMLETLTYVLIGTEDGKYVFQAETAGEVGNKYLGEMQPLQHMEGLAKAILLEVRTDGEDTEDDETLRARYKNSFLSDAFGGNISDYKQKVLSLENVGAVKVYPVWNGGGTVKLVVADRGWRKPSQVELEELQAKMDPNERGEGYGIAPIGHKVRVEGVTEVVCNISLSLLLEEEKSLEALQEEVQETFEDYFAEVRKSWADKSWVVVRKSYLEARILEVSGVLDVLSCKINGEDGNLTLLENQIPILGGIEVN